MRYGVPTAVIGPEINNDALFDLVQENRLWISRDKDHDGFYETKASYWNNYLFFDPDSDC